MPRSTTRPSSITWMASAARIVESRWAITRAVRPGEGGDERLLHGDFGLGVEVCGRLVEDHHPGPGEQEPSNREPLALAAREPTAALADYGVEPVGQRPDQGGQPSAAQGVPQLVVAGVGRGVAQVGPDRVVEQVPALGDHANRAADGVERQLAHINGDVPPGEYLIVHSQAHGTGVDVVEPGHQRRESRLAGAGGADGRRRLARFDPERHAVRDFLASPVVEDGHLLQRRERHLLGRGAAEADILELDRHRAIGHLLRIRVLRDERHDVEHLEDPFEADQRRLDIERAVAGSLRGPSRSRRPTG